MGKLIEQKRESFCAESEQRGNMGSIKLIWGKIPDFLLPILLYVILIFKDKRNKSKYNDFQKSATWKD